MYRQGASGRNNLELKTVFTLERPPNVVSRFLSSSQDPGYNWSLAGQKKVSLLVRLPISRGGNIHKVALSSCLLVQRLSAFCLYHLCSSDKICTYVPILETCFCLPVSHVPHPRDRVWSFLPQRAGPIHQLLLERHVSVCLCPM